MPEYREPADTPLPDRIPPVFWWMFWSGPDPMFLRLPEHAWYMASRMLSPKGSRRHLPAETWALEHLPDWAMDRLLGSRGYDDTPTEERMELRLSHPDPRAGASSRCRISRFGFATEGSRRWLFACRWWWNTREDVTDCPGGCGGIPANV